MAYNLFRARKLRGWTQEEAAEQLEPFLGVRWSKATWSAAEQTYRRSDRPRRFTPDEIVAFSRAFKLPIGWWFLPPDPTEGRPVLIRPHDGAKKGMAEIELLSLIFPVGEPLEETERRYAQLVHLLPAESRGWAAEQPLLQWAAAHTAAAVEASLGDLAAHERNLRELADALARTRQLVQDRAIEDLRGTGAADRPHRMRALEVQEVDQQAEEARAGGPGREEES